VRPFWLSQDFCLLLPSVATSAGSQSSGLGPSARAVMLGAWGPGLGTRAMMRRGRRARRDQPQHPRAHNPEPLLVSQRHHRIDPRARLGRDQAGERSDTDQEPGDRRKGRKIRGRHIV